MNSIFERYAIEGEGLDEYQQMVWTKCRAFPSLKEAREILKVMGNHDPSKAGFQRYRIVSLENGNIFDKKEAYDRNGRTKARELARAYRQISIDLSKAAQAPTQQDRIVATREILERLEHIKWT